MGGVIVENIPKVLVITMYCGEPQIERCISSVKSQAGLNCTHTLIENRPNVEAHRELYRLINEDCSHDFYIKLDADMEFSSADSLYSLISFFSGDVDYITIPVFDYITNDDMPALHIYNKNVRFDLGEMDKLYVDNVDVIFPGYHKSVGQSDKLVYHCRHPSVAQAFAFGIHRALKVCQYDRKKISLGASRYHFYTLRKVYDNYMANPEFKELHYALVAAVQVFQGKHNDVMENKIKYMDESLHKNSVADFDLFKKNSVLSFIKVIGFRRFLHGVVFYFLAKINSTPSRLRSLISGFFR